MYKAGTCGSMYNLGPVIVDNCLAYEVKRQMSRQGLCHGRKMGLHPLNNGELLRVLGRGLDGKVSISEIHSSSHAEKG